MKDQVRRYLAEIGRKGGKKSRRKLSTASAREMVRVREARRAFRRFYHECFWSFDPRYKIEKGDVHWVAEQLMKNGNRLAWTQGAKLCR